MPSFWTSISSWFKKSAVAWRRLMSPFPLTARRFPVATKWICFVVGCLGMASSSTIWQNAWQNGMRAIYNQTETDANLVSTIGGVGACVSLPAGIVYELYGPQMNSLLSVFMTGLGFLFLWLGTSTIGNWRADFAANQSIVQVLYFFVGLAGAFMYMASFLPNAENFTYEQRGKVFGILNAVGSVTPTLLSVLYNAAFTNGKINPGEEDQQNLAGYFLTLGIFTVVSNILVFLLVGAIAPKDQTTPPPPPTTSANNNNGDLPPLNREDSNVDKGNGNPGDEAVIASAEPEPSGDDKAEKPPCKYSEFPFVDVPFTRVIFRWSFWYILAQFILCGCTQNTYQANIPSYLRSFNMNEHNLLFTSLNTGVQAVSKFASGFLSDLVAADGRFPRAVVFLIPYALQTVFILISAFYGDNFVVMLLTCIVTSIATGFAWCQTPIVVGELFGTKHLGSNWGLALITSAAMGFPFSLGFSAIYEAEITQSGEIYCYGLDCFKWSYILLSGTTFCSLLMAIALTQHMFENAKHRCLHDTAKMAQTTKI